MKSTIKRKCAGCEEWKHLSAYELDVLHPRCRRCEDAGIGERNPDRLAKQRALAERLVRASGGRAAAARAANVLPATLRCALNERKILSGPVLRALAAALVRLGIEEWRGGRICSRSGCYQRHRTAHRLCPTCREIAREQGRAMRAAKRAQRNLGPRGQYQCGYCGERGHNARACPQKLAAGAEL